MYLPKHFEAPDAGAMLALMARFPLAAVVVRDGDALEANHLPMLHGQDPDGCDVLRGHVARGNPLARLARAGVPALAMFQGEEHYVSPGWYPAKQAHGRVVPTWNYRVVHVHGTLHAIDDAAWLRRLVEDLTDRHERASALPWRVADAPAEYIDGMLRAIVGVELRIARIEGKWKLSQNRARDDRVGVIDGLRARGTAGAEAMAGAMAPVDGEREA